MTNQVSTPSEDDILLGRVREAVAAGVAPGSLAARVGRKPAIDTTAGFPLEVLRGVDLIPDPDHPSETFARDAETVVYWIRPGEAKNPRVVGVQVGSDGKPRLFFGIVLPP